MEQLEVARNCLEFGVATEEEPGTEEDSDRGSLSPEPKAKSSTVSSRLRTTFKSPRRKEPIRSPDCKDLSFLEHEEEPFHRVQEELGRMENHYVKLETVVRNASRLLGDCKASNIGKEIRKLKQEDSAELKKHITHLKLRCGTLQDWVNAQDVEISQLKERSQSVAKIRSIMEYTGDVASKAHLFDQDVKTEGHLSQQKIVAILVKFAGRVETALEEMRKLAAGRTGAGSSQQTTPPATSPLVKSKYTFLESLMERVQERQVKEALETTAGIEVPSGAIPSGAVLFGEVPSTPVIEKGKEPEQVSRAASSEPTSEKGSNRKKKTTPEAKKTVELLDSDSTEEEEDEEEEEEEEEPEVPLTDKRKAMATRSSEKKKPPVYKSPQAPKRQRKTSGKAEGSQKRTRK